MGYPLQDHRVEGESEEVESVDLNPEMPNIEEPSPNDEQECKVCTVQESESESSEEEQVNVPGETAQGGQASPEARASEEDKT